MELDLSNKKIPTHLDVLSLFNLVLLIVSGLVFHLLVSIHNFIVPAGILLIPLYFSINQIILKLYGKKYLLQFIRHSSICLFIFAILISILVKIPAAHIGNTAQPYKKIFGNIELLYLVYIILSYAGTKIVLFFEKKQSTIAKSFLKSKSIFANIFVTVICNSVIVIFLSFNFEEFKLTAINFLYYIMLSMILLLLSLIVANFFTNKIEYRHRCFEYEA